MASPSVQVALSDILDTAELQRALDERFVVRRLHPRMPLAILNYTERCQYEAGAWNETTRACRGIIYQMMTGEVLARPFRKFFNYGQTGAPQLDPITPTVVTDKLDGSLGILYPTPSGFAIATRGSFDGEQALHASAVWASWYADYRPPRGWTLLFEIVYPENRIVLDYGILDDLVLLGAVEVATGRTTGPNDAILEGWPGPRAVEFPYSTMAEALAAPPRPNAEGLVIHFPASDERVKVKQEDYVALHRIVTGLNERSVWEHVSAGKPLADLLAVLPDEFHGWTAGVAMRLAGSVDTLAAEVEALFVSIESALPVGASRKDFALRANAQRPLMRGTLFSRLDGKDYHPNLWKSVYPAGQLGPRAQHGEDSA